MVYLTAPLILNNRKSLVIKTKNRVGRKTKIYNLSIHCDKLPAKKADKNPALDNLPKQIIEAGPDSIY